MLNGFELLKFLNLLLSQIPSHIVLVELSNLLHNFTYTEKRNFYEKRNKEKMHSVQVNYDEYQVLLQTI